MKNNSFMILFTLIGIIGCEDDKYDKFVKYVIQIDENCSDIDVANIERAIFRANEMTMELLDQDMIVIEPERTTVDYDLISTREARDDDIDQVACFHEKPTWWGDAGRYNDDAVGNSNINGGDIKLFLFQGGDVWPDWFMVTVVMHELMHYLGVRGHVDDPNSVSGGNSTVYTDADKEFFCQQNECL